MSRPRRWIVWPVLAVLTLLVLGGCGLLAFTTCHPPDRVHVRFVNAPSETEFISLAAISDNGPETMLWSMTHIGMPFEMHPADYHRGCDRVRWRFGEKYGVVMQTNKGEWRVAWFPASEVPLKGRTLLGGGKAEFDLSRAEIVPLDADTVRSLGLQDVKPPEASPPSQRSRQP